MKTFMKNVLSISKTKEAKELNVIFDFAIDESGGSMQRTQQVHDILSQILLLAHKNGRPRKKEDIYEEAA